MKVRISIIGIVGFAFAVIPAACSAGRQSADRNSGRREQPVANPEVAVNSARKNPPVEAFSSTDDNPGSDAWAL